MMETFILDENTRFAFKYLSKTLYEMKSPLFSNIESAFIFGKNGSQVLFKTIYGNIYGIGPNKDGYLGTGRRKSYQKESKIEILSTKNVKLFVKNNTSYNEHFILCLTLEGDIYGWGDNRYFVVSSIEDINIPTPREITKDLDVRFTDIACGRFMGMGLTESGEVFMWGYNGSGQLGDGTTNNQIFPRKVNPVIGDEKVRYICCCENSSFALLENGKLYSWGSNCYGQLGLDYKSIYQRSIASYISSLSEINIQKIMAGFHHVILLSDDGSVFSWGSNVYGQLGDKNYWIRKRSTPKRLDIDDIIIDILAFEDISACLSITGEIYMWGKLGNRIVRTPICRQNELGLLAIAYEFPENTGFTFKLSEKDEKSATKVNLPENWKTEFNDKTYADVSFIFYRGDTIYANKTVLKSRCNYFVQLFEGAWRLNDEIEIIQFSYTVYHSFLYYIYTDEVKIKFEDSFELLELANIYVEEDLKDKIVKIVKNCLNLENFSSIYSAAVKYKSTELTEYAFGFALENINELADSGAFQKLNQSIVSSLIKKLETSGFKKTLISRIKSLFKS